MAEGTWVKIGCDERNDIVRKASGARSLRTTASTAIGETVLATPQGQPLVRDWVRWVEDARHCSHERFVAVPVRYLEGADGQ